MENLLQSLYVENRAGFFFTKFCEDSGNQVEKNYLKSNFIILLHLKISSVEIIQCSDNYIC
jgi:hypothetical protein